MTALPHRFECLVRSETAAPLLLCGAGLSYDLVPSAADLYATRRTAEDALGCGTVAIDESCPDPAKLYAWAEKALAACDTTDPRPAKLRLCEALGILDQPHWLARSGLPLRGTTPRHRVIARLAREGKWVSLWTLNWDRVLESALEEVGLVQDGPALPFNWRSAYTTHVTNADLTRLGRNHCVSVHKPHGCVHAMIAAQQCCERGDAARAAELSDRFMIGEKELTDRLGPGGSPDPVDHGFSVRLATELKSHPLVVVGWRASEPVLRKTIADSVTPLRDPPSLSVVDIAFNADGHAHLANAYATTPERVSFAVHPDRCPSTDQLFLWIQSRYAMHYLGHYCDPEVRSHFDPWTELLSEPCESPFLDAFADDFLPAWTRLCWRAGIVPCRGFQPHELDLWKPDAHVPLDVANIERPDLSAAANLLTKLPVGGGEWDPARFPGALWHERDLLLVVPMPAWGEPADLAGLRPLLRILERDKGFVRHLDVLPLTYNSEPIPSTVEHRLVGALAGLVRSPRFAEQSDARCADRSGIGIQRSL